MTFEQILKIIQSPDSDYLTAARIYDALQTQAPASSPKASPAAGMKPRKARGPNKPKGQPAGIVERINGMTDFGAE